MTTTREISMPEMSEEQRRVYRARQALHRDGASPAGALELLAAIVADRTWERLADKHGQSFAGRFRDFVKEELGYDDPAHLPKVLELQHPHEAKRPEVAERMAEMRKEIRKLLKGEIEPVGPIGKPRGPMEKHSTTTLSDRNVPMDRGSAYTVARLKRDDPDLAERVTNGEVSAYAAARSKGWKPPRIQVTTPERIAAHLRKHMPPDQLAELARLLTDERVTDG